MATVEEHTNSVADVVKHRLNEARDTLIERNLRNKLVNCLLTSKRSRQIRVVDEIPDEVFRALLGKREFVFSAGRGIAEEEASESDTDADIAVWTPPENDDANEAGVARRHRDNALQTQLTPEGLQKRLTALYYEAREVEEEQGVNVLYLALGFLKWFESGRSDVERFAPLVLIPVELTREGARERFKIKARDEDLFTNVSLRVWLAEQHSINLPELPEGDEWLPSSYFDQVRAAIANAPRWELLPNEILLGFFSFNKFLLWRDLDPKNWPSPDALLGHGILRTLLAPHEETPVAEPPVIRDDARVDTVFALSQLAYVLDADSSQTAAIQTALAGRNMVVQGPPGTGKSQTITNLIAAAIHDGKSVLFVAEKLAALQVVFERLKSVGLGHLCFELHSRKASKPQVLAQLKQAIDAPTPPGVATGLGADLDAHAASLWDHSDRMHQARLPSGYTPFQVIGRICRLRDSGAALPDFKVAGVESAGRVALDATLGRCSQLAERLRVSGVPAKHPWRHSEREPLNPLDQQRLQEVANRLAACLDALAVVMRSVWPLVRPSEAAELSGLTLPQVESVAAALDVAAEKPAEAVDLLCHPEWTAKLGAVDQLVSVSRRLAELQTHLDQVFVPAAWQHDWGGVRAEIAASGKSLFRLLRGSYRDAMRRLRGACKTLPPTHDERVAALDRLIEAIELKAAVQRQAGALQPLLGELVDALPTGWARLNQLATWQRRALALEPQLSVRNKRLLSWSEAPSAWAKRIRDVRAKSEDAFWTLTSSIGLVSAGVDASAKHLAWPLSDLVTRASDWKLGVERFNEWPPARDGLRWLESVTGSSFTERVYRGAVPPAELQDRVHLAIFEQLWNAMVLEDPDLARTDGRVLHEKVQNFRTLDRKRIAAAALEVAKKQHSIKPTGSVGDMGVIRAELNKSRKHLPVRRLLENAGHAVQQLKPVFLMSPLSVAQYLAPGRLKFDLLLIDEASQVRPADALGAVARSGQIVVVGDAKQLPPTNFFNRMVDDDALSESAPEDEDVTAPLGAMESILSLCDATFSTRAMLAWHYRSQHPALIAVSNRNFYENKLLLPPSTVNGRAADGLGVMFQRTPSGGYDRGRSATNVVEADLVADAVCRFAREHPEKSLGVGCFSVAQRDAIRARIDARRRDDPALESFFTTSRPQPFFVKNLESIQGDERDVIFISVGYGRDKDGRLTQSFGPINADGGERRLNVLISRARERCEVFSSISAEDIDVSSRKPGTVALREFLQYAEKGYFDVPLQTERTFDSDFEESVATFISTRGFTVHPQVGMAGFFIDLGIIDPANSSRYILGVECDGATYHSSRSARDRDRIRQEILESRGWSIYRIWSTDWFHRRAQEEGKLTDALVRAVALPAEAAKPRRPRAADERPISPPVVSEHTETPDPPGASPPYIEASFRVKSSVPPHEAPVAEVANALLRIVEIEGPIHEEELARRLATVWGLDRAGSRIRAATRTGLSRLVSDAKVSCNGAFWVPEPPRPVVVRSRAETSSSTLRKAEYLPPAEIVAAGKDVLGACSRVHHEQLVVEVARRLGFQRTGQELQDAISAAMNEQIGNAFEADPEGHWKLMNR